MTDTSYRKHLPLRRDAHRPWIALTALKGEVHVFTGISLVEDKEFTEFIIRAANCHDELVGLLERAAGFFDLEGADDIVSEINNLIAKAKGERP